MSKYLIDGPHLQVSPKLAEKIGLNEAIVLQQINYWINSPEMGMEYEGRRWIYNSITNWQETNFPFWSESTIKRALDSLKVQGLIVCENLNQKQYDRTLWYTIDQEEVGRVEASIGSKSPDPLGHFDLMDQGRMTKPIPETTTQTTSENTADAAKNAASARSGVIEKEDQPELPLANVEPPQPPMAEDPAPDTPPDPKSAMRSALDRELESLDGSANQVRRVLELWFRLYTDLSPPASAKSAGSLWWKPLREIAEKADWDVYVAMDLMGQAVKRLVKGATIKSPKSLLSTIDTLLLERIIEQKQAAGKWAPGDASGGDNLDRRWIGAGDQR